MPKAIASGIATADETRPAVISDFSMPPQTFRGMMYRAGWLMVNELAVDVKKLPMLKI